MKSIVREMLRGHRRSGPGLIRRWWLRRYIASNNRRAKWLKENAPLTGYVDMMRHQWKAEQYQRELVGLPGNERKEAADDY